MIKIHDSTCDCDALAFQIVRVTSGTRLTGEMIEWKSLGCQGCHRKCLHEKGTIERQPIIELIAALTV